MSVQMQSDISDSDTADAPILGTKHVCRHYKAAIENQPIIRINNQAAYKYRLRRKSRLVALLG